MGVRSIAVALLSTLALFVPLSASQTARASCERRTIIVTVSDKNGPVMNLNMASVRLDSKPPGVEVAAFTPRRQPVRALLLIDLSGSMRTPGKLKVVSELARGFVDASPANSPFSLLTFGNPLDDQLGFPASKEVILQKLQAIKREPPGTKGGYTALFDAMTKAIEMFGSAQPGDVVFLVSDGGDNRSRTRMRDVKRLLLERGIRLFCLVPFEGSLKDEEARMDPDSLDNVAQETGGRSLG
ncbi:MAG TPA: VWA domain-containing protein [Terriglobales bacterium]|nr:VWA domain-containing protein [Terriglobales bacterium]